VTLLALANDIFLIPNQVFSGGATGLAIVVNSFIPVPVGVLVLLINVPLVIAGVVWLGGWRFLSRTAYAVVAYAFLLDGLAPFVTSVTSDPLLYTLYGGLMAGTGVGLVFRARGTTGGDDIGAQLLHRFAALPVNSALVMINAAIFLLVGLRFGPEHALYALVAAFAASQAVRFVQEGFRHALLLYIISTHPDTIAVKIQNHTGRGVTYLNGSGAFSGRDYRVILTAVRQQDLSTVTALVRETDPHAFIIVNESREVMGHGFKEIPAPEEPVKLPIRIRVRRPRRLGRKK
jgi:uncharacterized membrane-anchored protein YitT (DUF2179 family)